MESSTKEPWFLNMEAVLEAALGEYSGNTLALLLEKLKRVKPAGDSGICVLVHPLPDDGKRCLRALFLLWPDSTGYGDYPVPCEGSTSYYAFHHAQDCGLLWADTPYGNSRRALLAFCVDILKAEIARRPPPPPFYTWSEPCGKIKKTL